MTKKIFAMFLAVLMVVSMLPTSVFAANECPGRNSTKHSTSNCDYTVVKVTDPTCGTDGHTSYMCNVCGYVFAEKTADKTGEHSFVPGERKEPTCIAKGNEAGLICEVCEYEIPGKEIPAVGKPGTTACEYKQIVFVDCTVGGKPKYECVYCGHIKEGTKQNPKEHVMNWMGFEIVSATEAVVECYNCKYTETVSIENAHDCEMYLFLVKSVAATCTTDGMYGHYECRVCAQKYLPAGPDSYYALDEEEVAELVIPAAHTYTCPSSCQLKTEHAKGHVATCVDTKLYCSVCKQTIRVSESHYFKDWETKVYPTCDKSGYQESTCENCNIAVDTRILPELGHDEVTVSVPATCGTFAYTFTYCTRLTCEGNDEVQEIVIESDNYGSTVVLDELGFEYAVTAPALESVSALNGLLGKNGFVLRWLDGTDELYVTGDMFMGAYLAASENATDAATLYAEKLENYRSRIHLYFVDAEGTKTYIEVKVTEDGKAYIALSATAPKTYWEFSNGLTTTVEEVEYCLSATAFMGYYFFVPAPVVNPVAADPIYPAAPYAYNNENQIGVSLLSVEFDYEGGYTETNHVYVEQEGTKVDATCTKDGSIDKACKYCYDIITEVIPAEHTDLRDATEAELLAEKIQEKLTDKATCVAPGYTWKFCDDCLSLVKVIDETDPAMGHDIIPHVDTQDDLNHKTPTGYIGYACKHCNFTIKLATIYWKHNNKIFDTIEDAKAAHGIDKDTKITLSLARVGNCDTVGIEVFTCGGCNKTVRVKQKILLKDKNGDPILDENKQEQWFVTGEHAGHRLTTSIEVSEGNFENKINHKDPTCDEAGWHITYKCLLCNKVVGKKAVGELEELEALGHDWVEDPELEYEAAPCDQPDYNNKKYTCSVCGKHETDGTKEIAKVEYKTCGSITYEMYFCHCGEVHIRSLGAYAHKYVLVAHTDPKDATVTQNWLAPTCYNYGWETYECMYCLVTKVVPIAPVEHENAAGEKFTDSCLDEVTDRHCVVCCEAFDHARFGTDHKNCTKVEKKVYVCKTQYHECELHTYCHKCTTSCEEVCALAGTDGHTCDTNCTLTCPKKCADGCTEHCNAKGCDHCGGFYDVDSDGRCLKFIDDGCQVPSFCHYAVEDVRGSTCVMDAHELLICQDCGDEEVVYADVNKQIMSAGTPIAKNAAYFYGHMPVGVGDNEKKANYTYLTLLYQEVIINDAGKFERKTFDIDNAEFVEYKAPNYNENGYAKFYCAHCDAVVEQILPKLSGLGFEMDLNAKEYSFGSLIEVTVSVNGLEELVYGFNFDVNYKNILNCNHELAEGAECTVDHSDYSLVFVGYEAMSEDFMFSVTDPEDAKNVSKIIISGTSAKAQNIEINEKTAMVKLYFRQNKNAAGKAEFKMAGLNASMFNAAATTVAERYIPVPTKAAEAYAANRVMGDFNNDGTCYYADLYDAMKLLTGELENGKTYDVAIDVDKDGVITVEDILMLYDVLVGSVRADDLIFVGMSEEEIAQWGVLFPETAKLHCVFCNADITADKPYCSNCFHMNPHYHLNKQ